MLPLSLRFPPLGNDLLGVIGRAEVSSMPGFDQISGWAAQLPNGPVSVDEATTLWLEHAVRQANDTSYRFDVHSLHGVDEPRLVDLASLEDTAHLSSLRIRDGRGTAKLLVLLGVGGDGIASIGAAGIEQQVNLSAGILVIAPAFFSMQVILRAPVRCLFTTAHGPAFR